MDLCVPTRHVKERVTPIRRIARLIPAKRPKQSDLLNNHNQRANFVLDFLPGFALTKRGCVFRARASKSMWVMTKDIVTMKICPTVSACVMKATVLGYRTCSV